MTNTQRTQSASVVPRETQSHTHEVVGHNHARTPGGMSTGAFAAALGVTAQTVRNWIAEGTVRTCGLTPGGHYRIPRVELDRLRAPAPQSAAA